MLEVKQATNEVETKNHAKKQSPAEGIARKMPVSDTTGGENPAVWRNKAQELDVYRKSLGKKGLQLKGIRCTKREHPAEKKGEIGAEDRSQNHKLPAISQP